MTGARAAGVSHSTGFARDPLAAIAVPLGPIVLDGRYRLLVGALQRLGRSRWGRWALTAGSGALVIALALLAARHFATTAWPLSGGEPGVLVAAGLLLLLAHGLKAYGWGRLFASDERPRTLALAAGNGGAALMGVVLPGRFDDAMRVAVVRRYPGCPAGVRVLCLSLVMLGLIDSVALAPLALAAAVFPGGGIGARAGLAVVAAAGVAAAGLILALPRLAASRRALPGAAGSFCTITSSNLNAIKVGSRVVYASAANPAARVLDSDLVIDGPGKNSAHGHVVLDLSTLSGVVTFSGGTGVFTHFHAGPIVVACPAFPACSWDGPYNFNPPN
jgi:hypothetical protein